MSEFSDEELAQAVAQWSFDLLNERIEAQLTALLGDED